MRRFLVVSVAGMLAFCATSPVWAHGGGTPRLTDEPAGPYRLYVWTEPEPLVAGDLHVTIAVTWPPAPGAAADASAVPVQDAAVTVNLVADADPAQTVVALALPKQGPNGYFYEVDTQLPSPGRWTATILVDGSSGAGQAVFSSDVRPVRLVKWWWFAGAALVTALALIGIRALRGPAPDRKGRRRQGIKRADANSKNTT